MEHKKASNPPPPQVPVLPGHNSQHSLNALLAPAFNEWMRRYTEDPERFNSEYTAVKQFLAQRAAGKEPDYGAEATAYLLKLAAELCGESVLP